MKKFVTNNVTQAGVIMYTECRYPKDHAEGSGEPRY